MINSKNEASIVSNVIDCLGGYYGKNFARGR